MKEVEEKELYRISQAADLFSFYPRQAGKNEIHTRDKKVITIVSDKFNDISTSFANAVIVDRQWFDSFITTLSQNQGIRSNLHKVRDIVVIANKESIKKGITTTYSPAFIENLIEGRDTTRVFDANGNDIILEIQEELMYQKAINKEQLLYKMDTDKPQGSIAIYDRVFSPKDSGLIINNFNSNTLREENEVDNALASIISKQQNSIVKKAVDAELSDRMEKVVNNESDINKMVYNTDVDIQEVKKVIKKYEASELVKDVDVETLSKEDRGKILVTGNRVVIDKIKKEETNYLCDIDDLLEGDDV